MEQETKKITLGLIVSWVLGVLIGIAGVGTLFTDPVPGILFILIALVLLPPVNTTLKNHYNLSLSGGVKVVLIIALLGVASASLKTESTAVSGTVVQDGTSPDSTVATESEVPEQKPVEVVNVSTKVTEQNSVWWKYAWILTLKNNTDRERSVTAVLKWVDVDGFVVDSDTEYSLTIPAGEEKTFNDFKLVSTPGASDVNGIQAELK